MRLYEKFYELAQQFENLVDFSAIKSEYLFDSEVWYMKVPVPSWVPSVIINWREEFLELVSSEYEIFWWMTWKVHYMYDGYSYYLHFVLRNKYSCRANLFFQVQSVEEFVYRIFLANHYFHENWKMIVGGYPREFIFLGQNRRFVVFPHLNLSNSFIKRVLAMNANMDKLIQLSIIWRREKRIRKDYQWSEEFGFQVFGCKTETSQKILGLKNNDTVNRNKGVKEMVYMDEVYREEKKIYEFFCEIYPEFEIRYYEKFSLLVDKFFPFPEESILKIGNSMTDKSKLCVLAQFSKKVTFVTFFQLLIRAVWFSGVDFFAGPEEALFKIVYSYYQLSKGGSELSKSFFGFTDFPFLEIPEKEMYNFSGPHVNIMRSLLRDHMWFDAGTTRIVWGIPVNYEYLRNS